MHRASPAIILRTIDYSDTSRIVRMFTSEYGKITVIAKGARRPKSPYFAKLEPACRLDISYSWKEGRDIQTLIAADLKERYRGLRSDLVRNAIAFTVLEMLDRAVQNDDPYPLLFKLITATLRELDKTAGNALIYYHFFQLHLSRQLGFDPHLNNCVRCNRPINDAVFDDVSGNLICTRCHSGGKFHLSGKTVSYLRSLQTTHISKLDTISATADTIYTQTGNFLLNYLFYHVDGMKNLRSIKFLTDVLSK